MLLNASRNIGSCYVAVKPQLSFRGDGYVMSAVNVSTTTSFKIDVKMRTTSFDGLLWQLRDNLTTLTFVQNDGNVSRDFFYISFFG